MIRIVTQSLYFQQGHAWNVLPNAYREVSAAAGLLQFLPAKTVMRADVTVGAANGNARDGSLVIWPGQGQLSVANNRTRFNSVIARRHGGPQTSVEQGTQATALALPPHLVKHAGHESARPFLSLEFDA